LDGKGITLWEACGNTIRNMTASYIAGKFKIGFSSSEKDSAYTFIHDLGFILKIKITDGINPIAYHCGLAAWLLS
jgi:sulfite reductase (ferredoxin)